VLRDTGKTLYHPVGTRKSPDRRKPRYRRESLGKVETLDAGAVSRAIDAAQAAFPLWLGSRASRDWRDLERRRGTKRPPFAIMLYMGAVL
jgi:acyl-CoA reductase-like NAD-dependent aldehyde dehydrogenase